MINYKYDKIYIYIWFIEKIGNIAISEFLLQKKFRKTAKISGILRIFYYKKFRKISKISGILRIFFPEYFESLLNFRKIIELKNFRKFSPIKISWCYAQSPLNFRIGPASSEQLRKKIIWIIWIIRPSSR